MKYRKNLILTGLQNLSVGASLLISNNGKMHIGKNLTAFRDSLIATNGGNLYIGVNVFFNRNCYIVSREKIVIGDNCIFGPNVIVNDHDHKFCFMGTKREEYNKSPIIIENNCWIGANVIILRDTCIGEGSIVGAGTVVKGKIPPHSLVTGERKMCIQPIEQR